MRAAAMAAAATVAAAACAHAPAQSSPGADKTSSVRIVAGGPVMSQPVAPSAADAGLRDQRGRRVTLRSLRGRIVVLAPQLTLCQETCPMTSVNLHQAAADTLRDPKLAGRVVFAELTVDPWRDTVHRLQAYQQLFGPLPNWLLLTGKPAEVIRLWTAVGVATDRVHGDEKVVDWMTGKVLERPYDVRHQDLVFVIGPGGRIRWIRLGQPDARTRTLPTPLARFLTDQGRRNHRSPGADAWTASDVEQAVRYVDASRRAQ